MSSPLTITQPQAVQLLTQGRARWVLGAFLAGENTVAAAAKQLDLDIRLVHRDVQALLNAGLLRVVREQKRAGRPIKVYQAVAPAFFVPFSATTAADLSELGGNRLHRFDTLFRAASTREFERLHREQGGGREYGVRIYLDPAGQVQIDDSYEGAELVNPAVKYQGPVGLVLDVRMDMQLTEKQAQAVQIELIKLLSRLRTETQENEKEGAGKPFLLRLGLVGVTHEDVQGLK